MRYKINLQAQKREKQVDRVIYFVLNYLRYILVITQIVVIGVFFYRFSIDQELVDLEEITEQKKEIVQVSQPLIKEAKIEAFRLDQAQIITEKQQSFIDSLEYLLTLFPENFFLSKLSLSKETISMVGVTQDPILLKKFLDRLKKEARFGKIELTNIKKKELGLEFSFELSNFKSVQTVSKTE